MAVVYQITNLINGHTYIGVTRFTSAHRWAQHKTTASGGKRDLYLYRAIRKYGVENFSVVDVASCINDFAEVERDVIRTFEPEYNMTDGGEITAGRRFSKESIERIRVANTGKVRSPEARKNISSGKRKMMEDFPETRAAMTERILAAGKLVDRDKQRAAASVASKNRVWSEESRAKLSDSVMGRKHCADAIKRMARSKDKPVECVELATVFDSVSEAARYTGLSVSGVSCVCRKIRNSANGLHFNFV